MKKILTVVGARPQFVKAAAVSREIGGQVGVREVIVHTGQHFDRNMSEVFFEEMGIPRPHYNLGVNSMGHGAMTGAMLSKLEPVMAREKPDWVLVYGDTDSTLAGALCAKKLHLRVAHVEAGLRSFDMRMPEEVNRILTDRISDLLFCPTPSAVSNLQAEGFKGFPCRIVRCGDVMLDAALHYSRLSAGRIDALKRLGLEGEDYLVCTVHRAENTSESGLEGIVRALNSIARELRVVFPVHPRTAKVLKGCAVKPAFRAIEPVGYFDMIELLKHAKIVLTDSGGLQKEAFFFKKPCVTLRDRTEWVELVEGGYNMIAGTTTRGICRAYREMVSRTLSFSAKLYGNGRAAQRIVGALTHS